MKGSKKYPDSVVFDEQQGFNAALLPYASNVGAPVISGQDLSSWKQTGINRVNHQLQAKFDELLAEYQQLVEEFQWNELIYSSRFNFEPIIGEIYHLYVGRDGEYFLSLIKPTEWNREWIGSFRLDVNNKWVRV